MNSAVLPAVVCLATGLFSCIATRILIPVLSYRNLVDRPNERSSHVVPTPRGGGIAVVGGVLVAWLVLAQVGLVQPEAMRIALGAVLLAAVSWVDDLRNLSPLTRLIAQGAAVAIGLSALPGLTTLSSIVTALLWIWWINLFNFMDGIDGIAGSEAVAISTGLLIFALVGVGANPGLAILSAPVIGAAIGFLVWNWSPARIFLGDVGSVPLGYMLGFLLLKVAASGHWKIALILPLYFLADATITLVRRLLRGERVWRAHREHFYQEAVRRGLGHAAVVRRVIAADLLLIGCAWAAENGWGAAPLAVAVVTVTLLLAALRCHI
jgi:UDP-N-acetylmuramyl pentapeptide phosphotransferase/UDP-N-acetylglucosamine-1-phosphate transferase